MIPKGARCMDDGTALFLRVAPPRSIAAITLFADRARGLAAVQSVLGANIPTTPRCVQNGAITVACLAPGRWLATGARDSNLPARLAKTLQGLAAVTDQSDMWETLVVAGPTARDRLSRVVQIDLNDPIFAVGHLALTRAGQLDVRLWRCGAETYEISVTRSFSENLRHALAG
jgi:sarcosine oxidase subunit gamma